jgi:hypothetical protein
MTIDDLIALYGDHNEFARITGISKQSWFNWRNKGYIPIKSQYKLQELTNGALQVNYNDTPHDKKGL